MQMSQSQFFVFIEGKNSDGFVHGSNCDRALADIKVSYEMIRSDQIGGTGSGKTRLLSHFKSLSDANLLINNFKGKMTASVFFMDKDLDDFHGTIVKSDHVIYTQFYDVESHIFAEGDIRLAVSATCNLSPQRVRQELPAAGAWQSRIARYWQEWVRLCFVANTLRLEGEANYGRPSPLNPKPYEPPDPELVKAFELRSHKLARRIGPNGCQDWTAGRVLVDQLYASNRQDEIFKGKWYAEILARFLFDLDPEIDKRALAVTLVKQMAITMKFESAWSRDVQSRVQSLAIAAGIQFPKQRSENISTGIDESENSSVP
ncbi:hypothetical protein ACIPX0_25350 [Streptomyces sp. NPDC090075]|uniref:hypothetical protein n=1 Tax=Streptomyces sp. NPDC090075 TaxID=3365937 RepID=UPI00380D28CC